MKVILTTLLLLAGCWLLAGCFALTGGRHNPGDYPDGNGESWTHQKPAPWPTNASIMPPIPASVIREFRITESAPAYDEMAPVSYKPMSVTMPPPAPTVPVPVVVDPNYDGALVIAGPRCDQLKYELCGYLNSAGEFKTNLCRFIGWFETSTNLLLPVDLSKPMEFCIVMQWKN